MTKYNSREEPLPYGIRKAAGDMAMLRAAQLLTEKKEQAMENTFTRMNDKPVTVRSTPVEVDAMRWTGTKESAESIINFVTAKGVKAKYRPTVDAYDDGSQGCPCSPATLEINNPHGLVTVEAGDIVVYLGDKAFKAMGSSEFWNTYEAII